MDFGAPAARRCRPALAASLGAELLSRVQGHPDLLPSDVTGVSSFSPDTGSWDFHQVPRSSPTWSWSTS